MRTAHASLQLQREKLLNSLRIQNESRMLSSHDKNIYKLALAMLYLGEGAKWKSHSGLLLGSSDPNIIGIYLYLVRVCYNLMPENLKCRVSYRADQNIEELENYWSTITTIPLENFYETKPDARTIGKPTRDGNYKGVCVIMGGGTAIQHELDIIARLLLKNLQGP